MEWATKDWENSDNFFFANFLKFDDKKAKTNAKLTIIALEKKSVEIVELSIRGNDIRSGNQIEVQSLDNNHSNTKTVLTLVLNPINFLLRQSIYNYTKQVLYSGQIAYGFEPILKIKIIISKTS